MRSLHAAPAVLACSCTWQQRDVLGHLVPTALQHHGAGHVVYVQAVMS